MHSFHAKSDILTKFQQVIHLTTAKNYSRSKYFKTKAILQG